MSKAHIPPAVAIRGHFNWKEKWIKRLISNTWLNFLYTVQLLISDVCTKFQNSRSSSSGEIFVENFNMHYLGVKIEKGKNSKVKEGKINLNLSTLGFFYSNTLGCPHCV